MPIDGGSGHGVTGGASEGSGSALAIAGVEIGVDAVEEMMATAEVVIWVHGHSSSGVAMARLLAAVRLSVR